MACYFGCGTCANKCAYLWYFLFLFGGVGCLVAWGVLVGDCLVYAVDIDSPCQVIFNQTSFDPSFQDAFSPSSWTEAINQTCVQGFGFPPQTSEFDACTTCLNTTGTCMGGYLALVIAGIVLCILTAVPCFFCCCCASPERGFEYKM